MLVVETVVRIRREYAAGKPIKAICRDLRLSRKVVRKAIRAEEGAFSYQRTTQPFPKIGPVRDRLVQLLTENEARPRRDRLRLTRVWDLLVQEGYDGSYDSVRRYAARWREETKTAPGDGGTAFVPLMFAPGEAFQFDFSHEDVEVAGVRIPGGSKALVLLGSANRDERVFSDPTVYDIHREKAELSQILSFGTGRHFCLGANLARLEARVVLEELVRRVGDFEVHADRAVRVHSTSVRGFASLPVTFTPRTQAEAL